MSVLVDKNYIIERIWEDKVDTREDIEAIIQAAPEESRFESLSPVDGFVRLTNAPCKKALAELIEYLNIYSKYHLEQP